MNTLFVSIDVSAQNNQVCAIDFDQNVFFNISFSNNPNGCDNWYYVKDKTYSCYADKSNRISKRRDKKCAIIAITRKILITNYHIFKTGEIFNPSDMANVETTKG